ncbi:hypothetical protein N7449_006057 [Penicillium cf. viridicatum]|uniref:Uncharacterized protein n=1 Tax=Penicillium cf. viridicatum TaxID=2972119 RepID=A0A9W9MH71_9EURO|nr:hypothetical protein N7449_006057 [Penicillium cf. viridicatum]
MVLLKLWLGSPATKIGRTIEGICILECYRVTILHGAATFSVPLPSLSEVNDSIVSPRGIGGPVEEALLAQLRSLMSPTLKPLNLQGLPTNTTVPEIWSLSCLSLLLPWASVKNRDEQDEATAHHSRRGEILESALHQWFRVTNGQAHISTVMLFHMICLNLHVNIHKIQNIAHRHCGGAGPPCITTLAMETGTPSLVNLFSSRIDRQNASWHAEQIIELALRLKHDNFNGLSPYEGTHFSYCVFFAALTTWYTDYQSDIHSLNDSSSRSPNSGTTNSVRTAIDVLSYSRVHVAKKLISTLHSLVANPLSR